MLGHRLITKQTPKEGILVKEVMIAEAVDIQKETYFCILMDRYNTVLYRSISRCYCTKFSNYSPLCRAYNGPVIIASPEGGCDIENVADKTPHLIKTIPVDIFEGITDAIAKEVVAFIGLEKYHSQV